MITRVQFLRAFIDFWKVAGLIKISKESKHKEDSLRRYPGALAIYSGLLTPARQALCPLFLSLFRVSISLSPFPFLVLPMTRGAPSDQSRVCLVSSHRYNECHCMLFPALIATPLSRCEYRNSKMSK